MKTEQQKYTEAFHKAIELKRDINELQPESQERLFQELWKIFTAEEIMKYNQMIQKNNNPR